MLLSFKPEWYEKIKNGSKIYEYRRSFANEEVIERIDDFLTRHQYAMPIISFQMTQEIHLDTLRKFNSKFVCPQMYYYLDNYPDLFNFVKGKAKDVGKIQINDFSNVSTEQICRQKY